MEFSVLILSIGMIAFVGVSAVGAIVAWRRSEPSALGRTAFAGCLMFLFGSLTISLWIGFDQWDRRTHIHREYSTTMIRYCALGLTMCLWSGGVVALVSAALSRTRTQNQNHQS
ncbi:hypothetical protein [Micromonospora sp. DT233]|uniref:hypothetical protein n=1 Tax=Micromonospora sp. DT233 TaxID=3393432 RepID=UPI003CFB07E2